MPNPYGPTLIEHFRRPHNRGSLPAPTVTQEGTNPLCGDRVRIELSIEHEIVQDAKFTANACAICVAAASVLTDLVRGAPLDEVETLTLEDLLRALKAEIPKARTQCVRLPLTVLHTGVMRQMRSRDAAGRRAAAPVDAVILAAGAARRFGAQKLVAPYESSTIIRRVVDNVRQSGARRLVVVVGSAGDPVRAALEGLDVTFAVNRVAGAGMSTSIVTGVTALEGDTAAVLIALGDQPTIDGGVMATLIGRWRAGGGPIVAPRYRGQRGNPVLFDRTLFAALRDLTGDRGARDLIAADPERVTLVDVAAAPPLDVDTASDYEALLQSRRRGA